jgi:hypothetical protein
VNNAISESHGSDESLDGSVRPAELESFQTSIWEEPMALCFYFKPNEFTVDRYEEAIRRLQDAGAGSPPGRSYHCAFTGSDGTIQVFDVWESQEAFDSFGETLVPIMAELGADPGEPEVAEVRNVILG